MALSEIEKLERRYAENPQGLTFAPLAEVHRKNGDVARALELLRPGLTIHPDYIPASIVLGRCHLDLGDLPAAEAAFTHVLGLDGENVIALKALADVSERLFRFDEAERLLRTLLELDRSNDEARDQLGRVETARRQAETASSVSPDAGADADAGAGAGAGADADVPEALRGDAEAGEPVTAESSVAEEPAVSAEAPLGVSLPPMPEPPRDARLPWDEDAGGGIEEAGSPLTLEELDTGAGTEAPPPEGIELEQPITLEEDVTPLAGLVGRNEGFTEAEHLDLAEDFRVETEADIVLQSSGGSEFQVANAAEELLGSPMLREPPPPMMQPPEPPPAEAVIAQEMPEPAAAMAPPPPAPEAEPAIAVEPLADPRVIEPEPALAAAPEPAPLAAAVWAPPVAEPPRRPEADLMITESMAVLLLEQGHSGEALKVYRHLESRSPDARFREKITELERAAAAPTPAYSILVTHGQSAQALLRGVLAARPPAVAAGPSVHAQPARAASAAEPEGAPTRPAHDSLSLSSVFGEESTPTLPAVPAAGSPGPGQAGVSYDEFFGAPGGATAPRPSRATDAKSDDLDQFHAWLQNLKR